MHPTNTLNRPVIVEGQPPSWLDNTPVCAKVVDPEFKLRYMSQAGVIGLGIEDINQFYGKPYPLEFYPEGFRTRMIEKLEQAKATGEPTVMEGAVTDLEGNTKWYQSTITPFMSEAGKLKYFNVVSIDTTDQHHAEDALLDNQKKLQSLASELVIAEERERKRIATLLHDDVCQELSYTNMMLHMEAETGGSVASREYLGKATKLLSKVIEDVRSLSSDLNMSYLPDVGLVTAISHWISERITKVHGIKTSFIDDGLPKPLDDNPTFLVFRSVRELLHNTIKHSKASHLDIRISREDDLMVISVKDNGIGFAANDEQLLKSLPGQGLFSIEKRMEQMGGEFALKSKPGQGCEIILHIPLSKTI